MLSRLQYGSGNTSGKEAKRWWRSSGKTGLIGGISRLLKNTVGTEAGGLIEGSRVERLRSTLRPLGAWLSEADQAAVASSLGSLTRL